MKTLPLSRGKIVTVDDRDFQVVSKYKWSAYRNESGNWYAVRTTKAGKRKRTIRMHRELLAAPNGIDVDHRDGDGLNNQRANLRLSTSQQNAFNRRRHRNKTTKFKGCYFYKSPGARMKPWRAAIHVNGKSLTLGFFANEETAAHAYDDAARKHFGEFACLNFPDPCQQKSA